MFVALGSRPPKKAVAQPSRSLFMSRPLSHRGIDEDHQWSQTANSTNSPGLSRGNPSKPWPEKDAYTTINRVAFDHLACLRCALIGRWYVSCILPKPKTLSRQQTRERSAASAPKMMLRPGPGNPSHSSLASLPRLKFGAKRKPLPPEDRSGEKEIMCLLPSLTFGRTVQVNGSMEALHLRIEASTEAPQGAILALLYCVEGPVMLDEEFKKQRATIVRDLAAKAIDPFIKTRLLNLVERYETERTPARMGTTFQFTGRANGPG